MGIYSEHHPSPDGELMPKVHRYKATFLYHMKRLDRINLNAERVAFVGMDVWDWLCSLWESCVITHKITMLFGFLIRPDNNLMPHEMWFPEN